MSHEQKITAETYSIYVGTQGFSALDRLINDKYREIVVLADENTAKLCLPLLQQKSEQLANPEMIVVKSGEEYKTVETCNYIWEQLAARKISRKGLLVNLGGGVVGDMGGFAASVYKRGIDFIQIPTTLLAQVDASVGGKTGIDLGSLKNLVGLFRFPEMVLVAPEFLKTLSQRQLVSGFAEVVKHGLIRDRSYWDRVKTIAVEGEVDWEPLISHSIRIKNEVVLADPEEQGLRKVLNFGHTIGHALEAHFLHSEQPLLHGEAIAAGMVCEAFLSCKILGMDEVYLDAISDFLLKTYPKVNLNSSDFSILVEIMENDKKNSEKGICFTLLSAIGEAQFDQTVSEQLIKESLSFYISKGA